MWLSGVKGRTESLLLHMMVCRLFSAKPLPKPMPNYSLGTRETNFSESSDDITNFCWEMWD